MNIPDDILDYFRSEDPELVETESGLLIGRPIYPIDQGMRSLTIGNHSLDLTRGRFLDIHILLLNKDVPEGTYPTTSEEIVANIGEQPIEYVEDGRRDEFLPGTNRMTKYRTGDRTWGESHGYNVSKEGRLYIARTLLDKPAERKIRL